MIKLQALENFTLERFNEIQDIERAGRDQKNWINKNDTFKCNKDLADYLLGDNPLKRPVVKVIEVVPEKIKDISPKDTKAESENIKPLNEEKLEEVKKQIEEHIQVSKNKKKKSSKK